MYFTRFIYFPLCIWCCSLSYNEEALDSLRIREIKMSFLDVFSLSLSLSLSVPPCYQCLPLPQKRRDRDRNKKGESYEGFNIIASNLPTPSQCFYYKANLLCGLSLLRLWRKEWPS